MGTSTGWLALIDVETGKVVNKASPVTQFPTGGPATDSEFGNDPFATQTASIDTSKRSNFVHSFYASFNDNAIDQFSLGFAKAFIMVTSFVSKLEA